MFPNMPAVPQRPVAAPGSPQGGQQPSREQISALIVRLLQSAKRAADQYGLDWDQLVNRAGAGGGAGAPPPPMMGGGPMGMMGR